MEEAFSAWLNNEAYIDGNGNYRIRKNGNKGPIAPWNKQVKASYTNVSDFHKAAKRSDQNG